MGLVPVLLDPRPDPVALSAVRGPLVGEVLQLLQDQVGGLRGLLRNNRALYGARCGIPQHPRRVPPADGNNRRASLWGFLRVVRCPWRQISRFGVAVVGASLGE